MKRIAITLAALALAAAYSISLDAQTIRDPQSSASLRDSLVLVDAQGSRTVSYPRTQISTEVSKVKKSGVHQKDRILNDQQLDTYLEHRQSQTRSITRTVSRDLTGYSVGSIPIEASVSASGARIYNVPLNVLPGGQLTPKLALTYNNQGWLGQAGYGWNISGLSTIEIRNRNYYYDGVCEGVVYDSANPSYALDGMPLVQSEGWISGYDYATAKGNVQIKRNAASSGRTASFEALFPDGSRGIYGYPGNTVEEYTFPLTQLTDRNGNQVTFNYHYNYHLYWIDEISYGNGLRVKFNYGWSHPSRPTHFSVAGLGTNILPGNVLQSVSCFNGSSEVRRYTLAHESRDGALLLKSVDLSSQGEHLPPLEFTYGGDDTTVSDSDNRFTLEENEFFLRYFNNTAGQEICLSRGRLVPGNPNDAVIEYPDLSIFTELEYTKKWYETKRSYKYGSAFSPNQEILCNLNNSMGGSQEVIMAGDGFQFLEPADVDGDGIDELVKVNCVGDGGRTRFTVTTYTVDRHYAMVSDSFDFYVNDGSQNKYYDNPAQCVYRLGDFRGTGRTMLLIMTLGSSKFALVDLELQSKLSESTLFNLAGSDSHLVFVADFENDGKDDLCRITSDSVFAYSLEGLNSSTFSFRTRYPGTDTANLGLNYSHTVNGRPYEGQFYFHVLDLNGDGYKDIVAFPSPYSREDLVISPSDVHIAYFNGKSFYNSASFDIARGSDDRITFSDVDNDGLPDLLHQHGTSLQFFRNMSGGFSSGNSWSSLTLSSTAEIIPGNTSFYGTHADLMTVDGPYVNLYRFGVDMASRRRISSVTDSFGNVTTDGFGDIQATDGTYLCDLARNYSAEDGFQRCRFPLSVLMSETVESGGTRVADRYYTYWDAVVNTRGLGFCGFGKVRTIDYVQGRRSVQVSDPERFGLPMSSETALSGSGEPFQSISYVYDTHSTTYGKSDPRLICSVSEDALSGTVTTTDITYDTYGFPVTTSIARQDDSGLTQTETSSVSYSHVLTPSLYVLGSPTSELVTRDLDGDTQQVWSETRELSYDSLMHPVSERRFAGSNLLGETTWQYDTFGNVTHEMSFPYDSPEGTEVMYSYSANGRELIASTDVLGHTTSYGCFDISGRPCSATDFRGRTTSFAYDSFGALVSTVYPDGREESITTAWGGQGLYTVTKEVSGEPLTVIHYDALGREVRRSTERFDGQLQSIDTEYNTKGQQTRVSLPFRGIQAQHWEVSSYDAYGRRTRTSEASGRISTWSYDGRSVTSVVDGVSTTRTTDACGNLVSVTDAGGTVSYHLRDDAQPYLIVAPGNVRTTFSYDGFGRRTQMNDPSAGLIQDSYLTETDGSLIQTHTTPDGTEVTETDIYGRKLSVCRQGEGTTSWSYDQYGRISNVQGTNGCSKTMTYDGYDRIVSIREDAPDGKWLRQDMSYGEDGTLSSIAYTSQSGAITTESYGYEYGNLTQISLSDGTTVWELTSENDLGQPTEAITGGVLREYGFSAYGMPTYRRMAEGELQNFSYQFDVHTGNLLSRHDQIRQNSETFGYDNLNRLTSMGSRNVVYDGKGNITSLDGVGSMTYGGANAPYTLTGLYDGTDEDSILRDITVTNSVSGRPKYICEDSNIYANITDNGEDERVKMCVEESLCEILTRWYLGGRYEFDHTPDGTKERLYLGGDAYSAPMVYQREDDGSWTAYNIGRDYLGSITHIATVDGDLVEELSYDPWGRLRDPQTLRVYDSGEIPETFLGRSYTSHEDLPWFGLLNANARLYDPLTGRFLSPDPYIQAPDFTQNFNRYAYCLNNPLRYTDESGEYTGWDDLIALLVGGTLNWVANGCQFTWDGLAYFGVGAAAGLASLYVSPIVMAGAMESINSVIRQGRGTDGKWDFHNIKPEIVLLDGAIGLATSYISGEISSVLSNSFGNITSRIPGKAWAHLINQGLTGAGTGFIVGVGMSTMNQIGQVKETGSFDWTAVWNSGWTSALTGLAIGGISGIAAGVAEAGSVNENPWAMSWDDINPSQVSIEYKSLGAKSKPFDAKKVSDSYLKQNGIDPHLVKYEYLGHSAPVSRYDLYLSKDGQIIIYGKQGLGKGIPTSYWIQKK